MMLICFGTRPEWIKIKPVVKSIKGFIPYRLVFTGQHVDILDDIGEEVIKLNIEDGENRLDSIVKSLMNKEHIFDKISSVFVQGDTTSVFAMALAGFHRGLQVIHLEAGLRTYNNDHPFPEEFNRRAVSCMATIHLCPTERAASFLKNEKVNGDIYVVGNTVLDNLVNIETSYSNEIIITMHRRENHNIMKKWFISLDEIAKKHPEYSFVFPPHPNPNVQKHLNLLKNIKIVEPIPYNDFVHRLANSRMIITDSGGIQEESSFFKKKCIVCRRHTERPEGLGTFSFLANTENIQEIFEKVHKDYIPKGNCPYGDGYSSERILEILKEKLNA